MSLAKLLDLFSEGRFLPFKAADGSIHPQWVAKLTPFEREQANHAGRITRSRMILALKEVGSSEYDLFKVQAQTATKEIIIISLLNSRQLEFTAKANADLRTDPDWREKIEVLQWSDQDQMKDLPADDPERKVLDKLRADFGADINQRIEVLREEYRRELEEMDEEALKEKWKENYIEERGLGEFMVEQQKQEVFLALRDCSAKQNGDGKWSHEGCTHERTLASPEEVKKLPDIVLAYVREAIRDLNMSPDAARFSDALASSSGLSEPSSLPGGSGHSGPGETHAERGGTSS